MKGFNPNAKTFRKMIVSALKSRKKSSVFTAMEWGYTHMGKRSVGETLSRYMVNDSDWLDLTDADCEFYWECIFESLEKSGMMKEAMAKANEILVSDLIESGFAPGKDFSLDAEGQLITSGDATEHLLSHIPDHRRQAFREKTTKLPTESTQTLTQIATNVGVHPDYFERLVSRGKARLSAHLALGDIDYCVVYLTSLIDGTEAKFPELKDTNFSAYIVYQLFGESGWKQIKEHEVADGYDFDGVLFGLWTDIVESTGDDAPKMESHDELGEIVTTKYVQTLSLVWESLGKVPLRELIGYMTSMETKFKRDNP
jgi:hypothetical protein